MPKTKYTINQLAELGNVTRRTVRYYIQRGLLDAPIGSGRGSYYNETHLARLIQIRDSQKKGVSLSQIDQPIEQTTVIPSLPKQQWIRVKLNEGVELHFQESAVSETQIQKMMMAIQLLMAEKKEK